MCVRMMIAACLVVVNLARYVKVREPTIRLRKGKIHSVKMNIDVPIQLVQTALHKYTAPTASPRKVTSVSYMHS